MIRDISKWFSGKSRTILLTEIEPLLVQAYDQKFWPKGASRKVVAALNKQNVAIKFARANERDHNDREGEPEGLLDDIRDNRKKSWNAKLEAHDILMAMHFGQVLKAPGLVDLAQKLVPFVRNESEKAALEIATGWVKDFAPVGELIAKLDATRPVPTYVFKTLSPSVVSNVGADIGIKMTSIRMPEIEVIWVTRTIEVNGQPREVEFPMARIKWPEGTRHFVSRFSLGSRAGHEQCHACGHAIKDPYNWAPILADTDDGPVSLWVGRDCARQLFGVVISAGDMEYLDRLMAAKVG